MVFPLVHVRRLEIFIIRCPDPGSPPVAGLERDALAAVFLGKGAESLPSVVPGVVDDYEVFGTVVSAYPEIGPVREEGEEQYHSIGRVLGCLGFGGVHGEVTGHILVIADCLD